LSIGIQTKRKHSTYSKFQVQRSIEQALDVGAEFTIFSVGFLLGKLKVDIMGGDTESRGADLLGVVFGAFFVVFLSALGCRLTKLQVFISSAVLTLTLLCPSAGVSSL
jgi:hypothetical protein